MGALAVYPVGALRKIWQTAWWDYGYLVTGLVTWVAVSGLGATASLANLVVELFWVVLVSVMVPWVRWLVARKRVGEDSRVRWLLGALTVLPMVVAVLLRLSMPTLAE